MHRRSYRFSWTRRVVFSTVATTLFFAALSLAVWGLERLGVVEFERPDDLVTRGPHSFIKIERSWKGPVFAIGGGNMLVTKIPVAKPRNTFRIVVAGGSFAMGSPYNMQPDWAQRPRTEFGSIPDWMRAELPVRYPSKSFEVVNAAAGALNSQGARAMVHELLSVRPDLIVVACSDNEGYVPVTGFNEPLARWVLYRALRKGIRPDFEPGDRSYFAPQDEDTEKIAREFQKNYREIVALCRPRKIPLMLVASPINLTFRGQDPRVHGKVAAMPEDDAALRRGGELLLEGRYEEALAEYAKSPHQGWAAKLMADCLVRLGRHDDARELYKVYVEELPMNRTRPSFNRFLRELSREEGLLLADLEKKAEDISPHGITSPKLYLDYCHMTWMGYYAMAQEVIRVLLESGLIPAREGEPLPAPSLDELIERSDAQKLYSDPTWKWSPGRPLYGLDEG